MKLIPVQPEIPSLHETLAEAFPVGAALMSDQLYDGEHAYLLTRHSQKQQLQELP